MLAPVTEAYFGEEELLRLNLASSRLYPGFVRDLEDASGMEVGYLRCGTLRVAFDTGDRSVLEDLVAYQRKLGLDAEMLTGRQARTLEPVLAPRVAAGALVPGDHAVDPRALTAALEEACRSAGVVFISQRGKSVITDNGSVSGLALEDGTVLPAATVVVAAGCWSRALLAGIQPPLRPVKGQVLILRQPRSAMLPDPFVGHVIRSIVEGRHVYLVPRGDGRFLLGATAEEKGLDPAVTVEAVHTLLTAARLVVPAVTEMEIVETVAGFRPASPDNAPMIGVTAVDGLVAATGHYRNGILLTPVTALAVAELLTSGTLPPEVEPFSPMRFR